MSGKLNSICIFFVYPELTEYESTVWHAQKFNLREILIKTPFKTNDLTVYTSFCPLNAASTNSYFKTPIFNPLNAELNIIRHLLALVGARHIVHVSRIRVNFSRDVFEEDIWA